MSVNTAISVSANDILRRKIIRYAFGILLSSAIAFGIDWPVSFMTIVLTNSFLLGPKVPAKVLFHFLLVVIFAVMAALILGYLLLPYRIIYTIFIGLILLLLFYSKDEVISPMLKTWLLISILVIPLVSLQDYLVGELVAWALVIGTAVALIIVWISFAIMPDRATTLTNQQKKDAGSSSTPSPYQRFITALKRTAVVYPIVLLFYYFEWQSSALILIYIGLYSSFPGFAKDFSVGKMLLVGCVSGGITFFLYEIVVMVPMYTFLLLLFLGFGLIVGTDILDNRKYAGPIKAGFSTVIIVFGSAVGSDDVDAGGKMLLRVIQVSIVVIYLVLAFGLIEKLFPPKEIREQSTASHA